MPPSAAAVSTRHRWIVRIAAAAALTSMVIEFGFPVSDETRLLLHTVDVAVVAVFVADVGRRAMRAPDRRAFLRGRWIEVLLVGLLAVEAVGLPVFVSGEDLARLYLVGAQVYILARLLIEVARANERIAARAVRPSWVLAGSFLVLILIGTGLLLLPNCRAPGAAPWSVLDAFFTSTSAACVTGLNVRNIGAELTRRGQLVLLVIIQLGGIGLPVLAMFASYFHRQSLRLHQKVMLREMMSVETVGNLGQFLGTTLTVTALAEALGAALLFHALEGSGMATMDRLWWSVFHSVSAFCNAGFALPGDSLMGYSGRPAILLPVMGLIIVGGLGFPVIFEILRYDVLSTPLIRRLRRTLRARETGSIPRLGLHARLVLTATAVLIVVGGMVVFVFESRFALFSLDPAQQVWAGVFQSVTARTAGFNTLDVGRLQIPTLLFLMLLMAIGASPVSTGGGVKTSAAAVLFFTVRAMVRGRDSVDAFGRSIPRAVVNASVAVSVLYGVALFVLAGLLAATQPGLRFLDLLFEGVSALSTVGLSTGVTTSLDGIGRLVLCAAMFVGRVGPLAIFWTIVARPPALRYQYPEESVVVS
ncbi:MAG: hypothetical protein HYY93_07825 [Planctomycetes bacterium]|nr:hypothetical protein [Planctomycetota bacterium]